MLIYWVLLAVGTGVGIPLCRNKTGKIIYCCGAGAVLTVIAALRRFVGYDYLSYSDIYRRMASSTIDQVAEGKFEKGFISITKLLSDYVYNARILFVLVAAAVGVCVGIFLYRYCTRPYLGFFFFLTFGIYFNSLNFMRQVVAALIVFFALKYIEKKQFTRFIILVLFAACFHYSALLMIPMYFILRIDMNAWTLGIYSAISVLTMIFSTPVLKAVTDLVYRNYDPDSSYEMSHGLTPLYSIFFGLMFIAAFIFRKDLKEKDSFNNVYINCMFFTFFFELVGIKHAIISRFALLFIMPAAIALMPQVVTVITDKCRKKFRKDKKKATIIAVCSVTAVMGICVGIFGYFTANDYNGVIPYHTVFYTDWGSDV